MNLYNLEDRAFHVIKLLDDSIKEINFGLRLDHTTIISHNNN